LDSQLNAPPPDPETLGGWFRLNGLKLGLLIASVVLVCRFLQPLDVLLAGLGLSLIIFLHELGHFLAAKACNVHVRTFSIGFGPALPFCQYKYGETTYKLGMIPLGGFVAMVGENTGETDSDAKKDDHLHDNDPRSFKNKSVPQRMLIISAGVIMNLILAAVCFIVAYMNGVEEKPAIIQNLEPGSAAWVAGIHPGSKIIDLNGLKNPAFDDIKPYVMATRKGETVSVGIKYHDADQILTLEPQRIDGAAFPVLGVAPPRSMTLFMSKRDALPPYDPGSAAANAKNADPAGQGFLGGDAVVAMSDPANPETLTPLDGGEFGVPHLDYQNRLAKLAGKPIRYRVQRIGGATAEIVVPPTFRKDNGLRMKMGPVVAVRQGSPAAKAEVKVRQFEGDKETDPGDRIVSVELPEADGRKTLYSVDPKASPTVPDTEVKLLDPMTLPYLLNRWADRTAGAGDRTVKLTVLRHIDHTDKPVTLSLAWDDSYREEYGIMQYAATPVPLGGLGLAYRVLAEVNQVVPDSPAAKAGILPNDVIVAATFKYNDPKKGETLGRQEEVEEKPGTVGKPKLMRWAFVDYTLQNMAPHKMNLVIDRAGTEIKVDDLAAPESTEFPAPATGLIFKDETRLQKANSVGEALEMGYYRTMRAIRATYQGLYGMVFGRISVKMMSGPITLARASYVLAGEDIWKLVLLVGLISINLAVVNFLPIPVLDGGHMMFLIYEGIFRKPAPEIVQVILTWIGLIAVLSLMLFTIGLDLKRVWDQFF
jgi:regulator of sigma E protease